MSASTKMGSNWIKDLALVASLVLILTSVDLALCKKSKKNSSGTSNSTATEQSSKVKSGLSNQPSVAQEEAGGCTSSFSVDYLVMSLTWAPGYCSTKGNTKKECVKPMKQDFSIHGFWPAQRHADSPTNCCTKEWYDKRVLKPLDSRLRAQWGSIDGRKPDGFWEYQWRKHGRCAHTIPALRTLFLYFESTLNLFQKLRLKLVLESKGYSPDNQKLYSGEEILEDLEEIYGARFAITCDVWTKNPNKLVLSEVRVCTNSKLELIDCSSRDATRKRCLGYLVLPST